MCYTKKVKGFIEIEEIKVMVNDNEYRVFEEYFKVDVIGTNIICIEGKTLELERAKGIFDEVGYQVEATRTDKGKGKELYIDYIWLQVKDRGWSEIQEIDDEEEISLVRNILTKCGIELIPHDPTKPRGIRGKNSFICEKCKEVCTEYPSVSREDKEMSICYSCLLKEIYGESYVRSDI